MQLYASIVKYCTESQEYCIVNRGDIVYNYYYEQGGAFCICFLFVNITQCSFHLQEWKRKKGTRTAHR